MVQIGKLKQRNTTDDTLIRDKNAILSKSKVGGKK